MDQWDLEYSERPLKNELKPQGQIFTFTMKLTFTV